MNWRRSIWGLLFSLMMLVSCAKKSPTEQQTITFNSSQLAASTALLAIISKESDGSISVVYSSDFDEAKNLSYSGELDNKPGHWIVLLTYSDNLVGEAPIYQVQTGDEVQSLTPSTIYFAELDGSSELKELDPADPDAESIEAFAGMVHVAITPPLQTPVPTPIIPPTPTEPPVIVPPTITPDSFFSSSYTAIPIDDGIVNPSGGTGTTWASNVTSTAPLPDHWVELRFKQPVPLNSVRIWWAFNTVSTQNRFMTAQNIRVEYWNGSAWVEAAQITWDPVAQPTPPSMTDVTFAPVMAQWWRVRMPGDQGPPSYTNIFWITEIDYTLLWP